MHLLGICSYKPPYPYFKEEQKQISITIKQNFSQCSRCRCRKTYCRCSQEDSFVTQEWKEIGQDLWSHCSWRTRTNFPICLSAVTAHFLGALAAAFWCIWLYCIIRVLYLGSWSEKLRLNNHCQWICTPAVICLSTTNCYKNLKAGIL